jgi:hypothetical protein
MPTEIYESNDGGFQLGGTAEFGFYVFVSANFNWTTNSNVGIDQSFYWDVGQTRLKWYRVLSKCEYITEAPIVQDENEEVIPNPSGRTETAATAALKSDDPSCDDKNQKHFYIQTILGRSPDDVCRKLREINFIWKILSMQEHGCPANLSEKLPGEDCNALFSVEYCGFPECEDFCVDFFAVVEIVASTSIEEVPSGDDPLKDYNNYLFNPDTTDNDPGPGYVAFNEPEEDTKDTTLIFISKFDMEPKDQTDWYDTFDESDGPIKGEITVTDLDENVICKFHVVDNVVPDITGDYFKIPVKHIEGTTIPDEDQEVIISFSPDYTVPEEIVPETDLNQIQPTFRTVVPSCSTYFVGSNCLQIPFRLYCYHNLTQYENTFSNFLKRNGFVLDPAVNLQYNANQDAWAGSFFFNGSGDGGSVFQERWKFIFEWTCLPINQAFGLLSSTQAESLLYGDALDDLPEPDQIGLTEGDVNLAVWMLRFWAQRKKINTSNNEQINYNSFFYAIFHAGQLCESFGDGLLDFDFKFDFNQNFVIDSPFAGCYQSSIIDRIGLFDSKKWAQNPVLSLKISWVDPTTPPNRLDIGSLLS